MKIGWLFFGSIVFNLDYGYGDLFEFRMDFIFIDAAVDSLFKLEVILVNGILCFYLLVVHGQPPDFLPSGQECFSLWFLTAEVSGTNYILALYWYQ